MNNAAKIIRLCYHCDDNYHYVNGFTYLYQFMEYLGENHFDLFMYMFYHPKMYYLLYSKYSGLRYKPERFDKDLIVW